MKVLYVALLLLVTVSRSYAQLDAAAEDSAYFAEPYPYILPILGDKAHERRYRFQLPFGVMMNYLSISQTLILDQMKVGFGNLNSGNEPQMYDLKDIVKFDPMKAMTSSYNVRYDAWLFPFLDVYGIYGKIQDADVQVNMTEPFPLSVTTTIDGWYTGYGAMLNGKVDRFFVSIDANQNRNHNPRVTEPIVLNMVSGRLGPIFKFPKRPQMMLVFWVGGMYSKFNAHTIGTINTKDLAPNASGKVDDMTQKLNLWYDNLGPVKQKLYDDLYNGLSNGMTALSSGIDNTYIKYDMQKTSPKPWNMLTGLQFQYNDRWQGRVEMQYLGARTAGLLSVNYRFGIRGKTWFSKD